MIPVFSFLLMVADSSSPAFPFGSGSKPSRFRAGQALVKIDPDRIDSRLFQETRIIKEYPFFSRITGKKYLLLSSDEPDSDLLMNKLASFSGVELVSPNFIRRKTAIPNDPRWGKLWNMPKIQAPEAWDISTGTGTVVVGVIDSGIDYRHDDLAANIWVNPGETPGNGNDDDGNGYVDDVYGFDFTSTDRRSGSDPMDVNSHGTHVAGIIGAVGSNLTGITGVNWKTQLMALRIMDEDGYLSDSDAIEAIEYAVMMKTEHNIPVVALNASWGGGGGNPIMKEVIDETEKAAIVFIAAAGNGGDDEVGDDNDRTPFYPASFTSTNILSVASSDEVDQMSDFSNYGAVSVDIVAPGSVILSTYPRNRGEEAMIVANGETIPAFPLEFSGRTSVTGIAAVLVDCGQGLTAAAFPPQVTGAIALIERGETYFREKVRLAMDAGAQAAVIYNNIPGSFTGTLTEDGSWIPALTISREDGLELKNQTPLPVTIYNIMSDYAYESGTSMAAPHVSGAISLIAGLFPQETISQWMGRVLASADPVPVMADKVRCGGRLNLYRALRSNLIVTLFVVRKEGSGWLLTRDAGIIKIYLPENPPTALQGYQFVLQKREMGGGFGNFKIIRFVDFQNGVYECLDKYLDHDKTYTYKVLVMDESNELIGSSSPQTI